MGRRSNASRRSRSESSFGFRTVEEGRRRVGSVEELFIARIPLKSWWKEVGMTCLSVFRNSTSKTPSSIESLSVRNSKVASIPFSIFPLL
jgi:hypothetical protein